MLNEDHIYYSALEQVICPTFFSREQALVLKRKGVDSYEEEKRFSHKKVDKLIFSSSGFGMLLE